MHIVKGQLARAMELLRIRHANTKQGGLCNIFIDCGIMAFVTTYYKNYQQTRKIKIIYRYLPQEVEELLFRYLQLVLLFWQAIELVTQQADRLSLFIWSDVVEKKEEAQKETEGEVDSSRDEGYKSAEFNYKTMYQSKQQTSKRICKIMQKQSEKWLRVRLNIST